MELSLFLLPILLATGAWGQDESKNEIFTTNLIKMMGSSGENVVFSPASLDTALSILSLGARQDTQRELFNAMGYSAGDARQAIAAKQSKLNEKAAPGAVWQMANRIMASRELPLKQDYLAEVATTFPGTAVDNYDFGKPEETAREVNSWVSDKTNQVIQKLLDPSSVDPNTRLIILNAVYFKGEWKHGFDKRKTKKECFFSEPGKCTMTDMMHIKQDFKYGYHNNLKSQVIELPYKNEEFSMVIVLPDERHGNLTTLLDKIDVGELIAFIDDKKWPVEVSVTLPKFEIEAKQEMKEPLAKLGIRSVFSDGSDLSGMISGPRARVSSVVHKAKITVDEEGTVAAAATGIQIVPLSLAVGNKNFFVANKPFLMVLRQKATGSLFAGVLTKFK